MNAQPPYPVLNPNPTGMEVVRNLGATDLLIISAITGAGVVFGAITGKQLRRPMMLAAGTMSAIGGFFIASSLARNRSLGWRYNGWPRVKDMTPEEKEFFRSVHGRDA